MADRREFFFKHNNRTERVKVLTSVGVSLSCLLVIRHPLGEGDNVAIAAAVYAKAIKYCCLVLLLL